MAEDFRPITNVPVISKIVEKVVCSQVDGYLNRNNFYSLEQHGFRQKHSTATALVSVNDSLMEAADRGDIRIMTLIDLSRAFDVVEHETAEPTAVASDSPGLVSELYDRSQAVCSGAGRGEIDASPHQHRDLPGFLPGTDALQHRLHRCRLLRAARGGWQPRLNGQVRR